VDREALLDRILDGLRSEITAIEGGESPLERYRTRCSTLGSAVSVDTVEGTMHGRAVDLDATGALVVEDHGGVRHVITGGEVTRLRPAVPA
jgi:biotin-(acetyl-CoA carboxylase) ligase